MHVLLIALTLAYGATETKVYRWTDENGVVHFSAQPPAAEQAQADEVVVKTRAGSAPAKPQAAESDEVTAAAELEPLPGEPTAEDLRKRREQVNAINCEQGRTMVQALQAEGRILLRYPDGREKWVMGEDRIAELNKARQMVASYC